MTHTIPPTEQLYSGGRFVIHERNNPDGWLACSLPVQVLD
jgi:hypothetical protein